MSQARGNQESQLRGSDNWTETGKKSRTLWVFKREVANRKGMEVRERDVSWKDWERGW